MPGNTKGHSRVKSAKLTNNIFNTKQTPFRIYLKKRRIVSTITVSNKGRQERVCVSVCNLRMSIQDEIDILVFTLIKTTNESSNSGY